MTEQIYSINALNICTDCNKCCKEPFGSPFILEEEYESIMNYIKKNNLKNHLIKIDNHYEIPKINGDCAYLCEGGKCEIYDGRPLDCRVFPIGFNESGIPSVSLDCPEVNNLSSLFEIVAKETLLKRFSKYKKEYIKSATKGGFRFK